PTPPTCHSTLSLHDALPISTFCRRGREVKHGKRRCTQSIEAVQRVEIADDRYDAMAAQPRDVARPARETVKLRPPTQEIRGAQRDRKSTRLNSSHVAISYAV